MQDGGAGARTVSGSFFRSIAARGGIDAAGARMSNEDQGGLAAALSRLTALVERPDERACEEAVRAVLCALPFLRLAPTGAFLDGLRGLRARLAHGDGAAARMDGMLAALAIACEEHDARVARLRCSRCGRHRPSSHVVLRALREHEERVCTECRDARLARGWSLLATEPLSLWCYGCRQRKQPMHCVGPAPDPMVLRVCDLCVEDLGPAGWRPAVSITHSF